MSVTVWNEKKSKKKKRNRLKQNKITRKQL
jgi:hypothetical protein